MCTLIYQRYRFCLFCHIVWQHLQWLKLGPPKYTLAMLLSFPIWVAVFFLPLPCKRHPAPQINPICSWPIYFLAIRKQVVESASLTHLSCVSISKQLVKTNTALSASPCCGDGCGCGIKHTHVHSSSFLLWKYTVTIHTPFWTDMITWNASS